MRRLLLSLVALGASLSLYAQQPYPELGAKLTSTSWPSRESRWPSRMRNAIFS